MLTLIKQRHAKNTSTVDGGAVVQGMGKGIVHGPRLFPSFNLFCRRLRMYL